MIIKGLRGEPMPVYGDGLNVRDWLYVEDHARALLLVLEKGEAGETYNVGGNSERTNLQIVEAICNHLDEVAPRAEGSRRALISYVQDRSGHDRRYAIDAGKITTGLGWLPRKTFAASLRKTVQWFADNKSWWDAAGYTGWRLGTSPDRKRAS